MFPFRHSPSEQDEIAYLRALLKRTGVHPGAPPQTPRSVVEYLWPVGMGIVFFATPPLLGLSWGDALLGWMFIVLAVLVWEFGAA